MAAAVVVDLGLRAASARDGLGQTVTKAHYLQWAILGVGVAATLFLTVYIKRIMSASINRGERV